MENITRHLSIWAVLYVVAYPLQGNAFSLRIFTKVVVIRAWRCCIILLPCRKRNWPQENHRAEVQQRFSFNHFRYLNTFFLMLAQPTAIDNRARTIVSTAESNQVLRYASETRINCYVCMRWSATSINHLIVMRSTKRKKVASRIVSIKKSWVIVPRRQYFNVRPIYRAFNPTNHRFFIILNML